MPSQLVSRDGTSFTETLKPLRLLTGAAVSAQDWDRALAGLCIPHLPLLHAWSLWISPQMEDGHTLFDYDVRLNDTIQLLVRQSLALPLSTKERDSELSDSDSGYGVGHSESDKSSTHGEGTADGDDKTVWEDTDLGLYKVRFPVTMCRCDCGFLSLHPAQSYTLPTLVMPTDHCTDSLPGSLGTLW